MTPPTDARPSPVHQAVLCESFPPQPPWLVGGGAWDRPNPWWFFLWLCWPGSKWQTRREGHSCRSYGLGEGFAPTWVPSPLEWNLLQRWSTSPSLWSDGTGRCTFFIPSYPSQLAPTLKSVACWISGEGGVPWMVSPRYLISQWPSSWCGALSFLSRGSTPWCTYRVSRPKTGRWSHARGRGGKKRAVTCPAGDLPS